jgi:hypothetical protein
LEPELRAAHAAHAIASGFRAARQHVMAYGPLRALKQRMRPQA